LKKGIEASLYIHIPFCASFCDYCDFYSVNIKDVNEDYIASFINALVKDIKNQIDFFLVSEIPSVYIGGGTPSVLGKKIKLLLEAFNKINCFTSAKEFTIEANPESIDKEFLSICRENGVNRLSLGVQTLNDKSRMAVNRAQNTFVTEKKLELASRYFDCNLSVDLITGLPHQSEETVLNDINRVLKFGPSHISLYNLTVENDTALQEKIKNKTVTLPGIDCADSFWLSGRGALLNAGFEHYEVSNFARYGKRCAHNIRYWRMQNWIAAGPAASGTIINENESSAIRFSYSHDTDAYIKNINNEKAVYIDNREELDSLTLLKECILMGYRYIDGADPVLFQNRFGFSIEKCIPKTLDKWKEKNIMLFLNSFLCEAFLELEKKQAS